MTLDEKLKLFLDIAMEDANASNKAVVDEAEASLDEVYENHVREAKASKEARHKVKVDAMVRDNNSEVSKRQIELRRQYAKKQEEYKTAIYEDVRDRLVQYKKTPEYAVLLKKYIKLALEHADGAGINIYIDRTDENLISDISVDGAEIMVSDANMMGGIRAEIPSKNILIDESFVTKLDEEMHRFNF